ncbi:uncharacterized protein LOC121043672 [Herpailurus yagouaroundi]|uniref:uncharacterized protein LOC121043672 n=1 Tax=Herpailurus yagouaroundi TaxID=1608482 RepID=UPI001AD75969|nr:uncharacterized protein LOC121043672 [Puma yagouaroundi]XP_040351596.1 uncharacterized protein LOC121043672 [Puma yagouaroundi]
MAGGPEEQGAAGLMRHSKSRCPPAGSDRGTRFPFRIKRVFPFFSCLADGELFKLDVEILNYKCGEVGKRGNSGKVPRLARGSSRLPFPPAAGCGAGPESTLPPPPRQGGAFFPRSIAGAGSTRGGSLVPGICWAKEEAGGWGLSTHSDLLGRFSQSPSGLPNSPPPPRPFPVCPLTAFSKHSCKTCFRLQPAAFAMRANCLTRCLPRAVTTLSSRSRLHQVPPHPFLYPTGRLPSAPRTIAARRERARRGRPHRWSPGPRRKGRPGEPQCRQKPRLTVGRFWVPSTRGHQKPSESCSAHAKEAASSF